LGAIVLWPFLGFVVRRDDGAVGLRGLRVPCAIVWGWVEVEMEMEGRGGGVDCPTSRIILDVATNPKGLNHYSNSFAPRVEYMYGLYPINHHASSRISWCIEAVGLNVQLRKLPM